MKVWYIILMKLRNKILIIIFVLLTNSSFANDNYYTDARNYFEKNELEKAKFLFQKNLVYNPKNADSYLYLGKIYKIEENEKETEKNLKTTLLLDPNNEEAMLMMMEIELKRSNFSKVNELKTDFEKICSTLCEKITSIKKRLNDFDKSNES